MDVKSDNHMIKLVSVEGDAFPMRTTQMSLCGVVSAALDSDPAITEFKVEATSEVLMVLKLYLEHHDGVAPPELPKPVRSSDMRENCADAWDARFMDFLDAKCSRQFFYDVLTKAKELHIDSLAQLGGAKIAAMISNQPTDRIHQILNVDQAQNTVARRAEAEQTRRSPAMRLQSLVPRKKRHHIEFFLR